MPIKIKPLPMFNDLTLKNRANIIFSAIIIVSLALNTAVLTFIAMKEYKQSLVERAKNTGAPMKTEIERYLDIGMRILDVDQDSMKKKADELLKNNDCFSYLVISDTSAKPLFSATALPNADIDKIAKESLRFAADKKETYADMVILPLTTKEGTVAGALAIGLHPDLLRSKAVALVTWALCIGIIGLACALPVAYYSISHYVIHPIRKVEHLAAEIAGGNLQRILPVSGRDEISSLGASVNTMTESLRRMVSHISRITFDISDITSKLAGLSGNMTGSLRVQQETVATNQKAVERLAENIHSIGENTNQLTGHSEAASKAVSRMASSIRTVVEKVGLFDSTTQETASSLEEMTSSTKEITSSLDLLASSIKSTVSSVVEAEEKIREVRKSVEESTRIALQVTREARENGIASATAAMDGMRFIQKDMDAIVTSVDNLSGHSKNIGKITGVISNIMDETTLLALNASILAAQAGEHGKGFAVVADAIKDLAGKTSISVKDISGIVTNLQNEVVISLQHVETGSANVENGISLVSNVNAALESIHKNSETSTNITARLNQAMLDVEKAVSSISGSITDISGRMSFLHRAVEEQNKGSMAILQNTEEIKEGSRYIREAITEQSESLSRMAGISESVHAQSNSIAASLSEQRGGNKNLLESVTRLKETVDTLLTVSTEIEKIGAFLKKESGNLLGEMKKFQV